MLPDSTGHRPARDMDFSRHYDLLIIGGGNAALCAAITARGLGLDVVIVESAPRPLDEAGTVQRWTTSPVKSSRSTAARPPCDFSASTGERDETDYLSE
jgi:glycine/D-amino acid oxidase-like deaminating enzyme